MKTPKHLLLNQWPKADHSAFAIAYAPGDFLAGTGGPGAHLARGTRRMIQTVYRRWLGFLSEAFPSSFLLPPEARISPERVRAFVERLNTEVRPTTVALAADNLVFAARLLAPDGDWKWLRSLRRRLHAQAQPEDRFERLVPGWQTVDLGIALMDASAQLTDPRRRAREVRYRDGLILAMLSCWPIRRRSIASLTVNRHVEVIDGCVHILLHAEDTKGKRAESFRVPDQISPYFRRYLQDLRPRLVGNKEHYGLWASYRGRPLSEGRIYDIARRETAKAFGKAMGLHDFRRASATFLVMVAPDQVGLIPGILHHPTPKIGEKHYNLARSVEASRRFGEHLTETRRNLRIIYR